jgi:hypothetical protein
MLVPAQSHLFWEGFMAWQLHPTASAGDRFQGSNKPPTVVDGLWSHHTGHYMLYFACHAEPVRLTEHLPCPRTSEQKKEKELSEVSAIVRHVGKQPLHHSHVPVWVCIPVWRRGHNGPATGSLPLP